MDRDTEWNVSLKYLHQKGTLKSITLTVFREEYISITNNTKQSPITTLCLDIHFLIIYVSQIIIKMHLNSTIWKQVKNWCIIGGLYFCKLTYFVLLFCRNTRAHHMRRIASLCRMKRKQLINRQGRVNVVQSPVLLWLLRHITYHDMQTKSVLTKAGSLNVGDAQEGWSTAHKLPVFVSLCVSWVLLKNMNPLIVFHLLNSFYNSMSSFTSPTQTETEVCMIKNSFQSGFVSKGDFTIGGIFPLHYIQEMPDLNNTYRPPPVKCSGWVSFMCLGIS